MRAELARLDATAQAELVRRGEVTPLELVDAAISRIEALDARLNAVILSLFEKARSAARGRLPDGPFRGVPFLLKDLDAHSAGDPHHCGMKRLRDVGWTERDDTWLVSKFRAAGVVILGKTNTPELGLNVTTEPVAYGPSRNPWNPEHSTGGSSGGSAAAVASGMVPVAHASDGGGSIRIPASECGLVGLKPSRGRISLGPDYGEYWSGLVISHVVSRSVRDTAAMLDCVGGTMPGDPYAAPAPCRAFRDEVGAPPGRLRVGLVKSMPGGGLHPDCAAAADSAAKLLASLGHAVEESAPEALFDPEFIPRFTTVVTTWTAAALAEWSRKIGAPVGPEGVEPGTWAFAETGRTVTAPQYIEALLWLSRYTRRMAAWWEAGFDLLLTPTLGAPPPRIGELAGAPPERLLAFVPFTPPFNATGQPAISLPLFWNGAGLPIGIQLVAAYGREDLLIRVAAELEQARPWADRRPPVHC
ncbi:MAG: amidase [Candidatus Binatia bacterium]